MSHHTPDERSVANDAASAPASGAVPGRSGSASARPLREVKVLVVGENGAEKTAVVRHLAGDTKGIGSPEGVTRRTVVLPCGSKGGVRLNLWEFAGQDHLHTAHQFFFTSHSVYVLALDRGSARAEYWLRLIQMGGGDSPVIVAGRQLDAPLWETFPQLKKCVSPDQVPAALAKVVEEWVDLTEVVFRKEWFALKDALEKNTNATLTLAQYDAVCAEHRVEVQDREALLSHLHDLGIILHFGHHPVVRDKHVLPPDWILAAIYRTLNDAQLCLQRGKLTRGELHRILATVPGHDYGSEDDAFILDLLQQFELCFPGEEPETVFLSDLLHREPPAIELPETLTFRYQYLVLPRTVMSRFIARMHALVAEGGQWLDGVLVRRGRSRAKVVADLDHAHIDILMEGPKEDRRQLLEVIRNAFQGIHATCGEALGVRELVPVPGHEHEELLDVEALLKAQHDGEKFVHTETAGRIPLLVLLLALEDTAEEPKRFGMRNPIGQETMAAKAGTFPTIPKPKPKQVPEPKTEEDWRRYTIYWAIGIFLLAGAMVSGPWLWLQIALGVIAVATAVAFARDPHYPHRRIALTVVAAALGAIAVGLALTWLDQRMWKGSLELMRGTVAIVFPATSVLIALVLFLFDTKGGRRD